MTITEFQIKSAKLFLYYLFISCIALVVLTISCTGLRAAICNLIIMAGFAFFSSMQLREDLKCISVEEEQIERRN